MADKLKDAQAGEIWKIYGQRHEPYRIVKVREVDDLDFEGVNAPQTMRKIKGQVWDAKEAVWGPVVTLHEDLVVSKKWPSVYSVKALPVMDGGAE